MSKTQEALKLALEALMHTPTLSPAVEELCDDAIDAINEALAEQASLAIYKALEQPAQRKPKTEEFIKHAWANSAPNIGFGDFLVLFRAIEASHNIKEKNT